MITSVKVLNTGEDNGVAARMVWELDDGERHSKYTVTVKRFYGESSCDNPNGTDNRTTAKGDFRFVQNENGLELTPESKEALTDCVNAFNALYYPGTCDAKGEE